MAARTKTETEDAQERTLPPVRVVYETIRISGEGELRRTPLALGFSALAAGFSMGCSLIFTGLLRAHLPDAPWRAAIENLGYTSGFLIVILGRQQLFTENTLTPILPLLSRPSFRTAWRVARLWAIVLAFNVVGCALVAYVVAHASAFEQPARDAFAAISRAAVTGSFAAVFWRAVFAGWLIATMVWLLPAAEGGGSVALIIFVTYIVGLGHFSHIIAGSVDVLYGVFAGSTTGLQFLTSFFVPTLLGNVTGGVILVSLLAFGQVQPDKGNAVL
ncbi:MAG: formate/nitrite transporter family protein [Candidatus Eremiobacteraeota bacterium]|nr:formate/nitrite transporter family protein [Candidatus Eremiobacteraeota bacterium]